MFAGAQYERDWTCNAFFGSDLEVGWTLRCMIMLVFSGNVSPHAIVTRAGGFGFGNSAPYI